nr:DUF3887 domain-containing protein [uncultured Anaeromusa sp.]
MKKFKTILIAAMLLFSMSLSICSASNRIAEQVKEVADPITENILLAINEDNYAGFSKDFDEKMKTDLNEAEYRKVIAATKANFGNYISKEFVAAELNDTYTVVTYKSKFSKEAAEIIIRNVLTESNGGYAVSGFWMDSPQPKSK